MKDSSLKVYINKELSGNLAYEDEQYVFNYLDNSTSVVSLTMPIRKSSWNSKKLHPIFEMNMPEGSLKEAIKNHFAKIQEMDDINFLKLIGPYMLGRVKFNFLSEESERLKLDDILKNTKTDLFEELMQKYAIRSGVSGVQPKLLLTAQNKNTMKFEHYIVKSWEKTYPQLALNEYFCMRAVVNAGLDTPDFYLSEDLSMFIMKRFDIKDDESYLGFEDMCVLTARGTDEKYNGSYEEVVRVIKDVVSPQTRKKALKDFFTALIMNHLLRNGDGHLKNYGVLYEDDYQDARLAPIYDVITTTVYIKNDIPALKLSGGKLWWKEKTYKTFAKQSCGLSQKEYEEIIATCIEAVKITKDEIDKYQSSDEEVEAFLENLKNCWEEVV
ncbi:type II toxin-antitoxin system HipA family toxin [Sulfurimonas aquatica]|uniref:Type II toxin-antitoxin system HipA family toxin n=1 Tax=Sulfurimonas aquatica TaxID=2672570 RepID=A0A975AZT5_9BACT|nr:type II toxin-antitoxin system HipA family toxin [Sulfurimonas aquatica]QSZ41612.1 type II toxin-antitoxin system HipA family toxin [Sulfurimonas aquatica]